MAGIENNAQQIDLPDMRNIADANRVDLAAAVEATLNTPIKLPDEPPQNNVDGGTTVENQNPAATDQPVEGGNTAENPKPTTNGQGGEVSEGDAQQPLQNEDIPPVGESNSVSTTELNPGNPTPDSEAGNETTPNSEVQEPTTNGQGGEVFEGDAQQPLQNEDIPPVGESNSVSTTELSPENPNSEVSSEQPNAVEGSQDDSEMDNNKNLDAFKKVLAENTIESIIKNAETKEDVKSLIKVIPVLTEDLANKLVNNIGTKWEWDQNDTISFGMLKDMDEKAAEIVSKLPVSLSFDTYYDMPEEVIKKLMNHKDGTLSLCLREVDKKAALLAGELANYEGKKIELKVDSIKSDTIEQLVDKKGENTTLSIKITEKLDREAMKSILKYTEKGQLTVDIFDIFKSPIVEASRMPNDNIGFVNGFESIPVSPYIPNRITNIDGHNISDLLRNRSSRFNPVMGEYITTSEVPRGNTSIPMDEMPEKNGENNVNGESNNI